MAESIESPIIMHDSVLSQSSSSILSYAKFLNRITPQGDYIESVVHVIWYSTSV